MAARLPVPLSVLDLCPVPAGESTGEALRRSVDLARHAERLGFTRYWVAEHHNLPGIASSAPAVLAGQLAAATLGDPGRLGRGDASQPSAADRGGAVRHAGGAAPRTDRPRDRPRSRHRPRNGARTAAQRRRAAGGGLRPPARGTAGLLQPATPADNPTGIRAIPAEGNEPALWLLGSTGYSAELAGRLGLPFAFAYHLSAASAANARPALALYRKTFTPSATLAQPYSLISVSVLCAKDAAAAHWLHGSTRLSALRQRAGRPGPLPSPEEAAITAYSTAEQTVIAEATNTHVVGDPATVTDALARLVGSTGADELMVTTGAFDHAARLASYELLARAAGHTRPRASSASQLP